jgi:hypothetical protein
VTDTAIAVDDTPIEVMTPQWRANCSSIINCGEYGCTSAASYGT